jgi:hypothetical protein
MAIRSIAQLKMWFRRGAYPTAEQFADWIDSFFHKEEKVPISSVDQLAERLNDKYDRTDGEELERRQTELEADFEDHSAGNVSEFTNVYEWLREKDEVDDQILTSLGGNPYMVDARYSADGTNVTATFVKYNAATGEQTTTEVLFPVVTEADAGAMSAEVYNMLLQLLADVEALKNQGGRFIGRSFATKAALDAWAIPDTVNAGDFTYVLDDETHDGATTRWIAGTVIAAGDTVTTNVVFRFGYVIDYDPIGFATLTTAGVIKSSTTVGKCFVEADGTVSVVGWDAMNDRITQTQTDYRRDDAAIRLDIAAIRQTLLGLLAETAGRVIPLVMQVTPPSRITLGNTVPQYIKAELLPSFAVQNVIFLGDGKVVDVLPDGAVSILALGKSRVHVIPTENTALHQTVEIEVVNPSFVGTSAGGALLVGDGMLLT